MSSTGVESILAPNLVRFPSLEHHFGTRHETEREDEIFQVEQVHGDGVIVVRADDSLSAVRRQPADALITQQPGIRIGVRTADCLPILIYAPDVSAVAAIHAGWRGTERKIVGKVVAQLTESFGARPSSLKAALGPAIAGTCYEIGPEVTLRFTRTFVDANRFIVPGHNGRSFLDIAKANEIMLREAGVLPDHIWRADLCTHCRPDLFHSYRRDGAPTGRLVSSIGVNPSQE